MSVKKYKHRILIISIIVILLILTFIQGGSPVSDNNQSSPTPAVTTSAPNSDDSSSQNQIYETSTPDVAVPTASAEKDAITAITPTPETDNILACTISVRCDTVLQSLDSLEDGKEEIVPGNGIILNETTAVFYNGESVFNVLVRELKRNKIHLEFVNTPIYNSAYIEGIGNLYEFDCGDLSGWMYKVNGWFPNYGCSSYTLKDGDKIEWVYTCNLGKDVGGEYSPRNGNSL